MPPYLTVKSNELFSFKSFEERDAQKYIFQEYFKENQIAGSSDYADEDNKIKL